MKGLLFSGFLPPERARFVEERWMPLVRDRCIVVMTGMIYMAAERTSIGERLLLPLAETPDGPVTGGLGMAECGWVRGDRKRVGWGRSVSGLVELGGGGGVKKK